MSMRSAASCAQPLQLNAVPRGALMVRVALVIFVVPGVQGSSVGVRRGIEQ